MTTKKTFKEHALRVVAVIGLIAVLLLGAWGIIQLAFFIPTFLGNIGGSFAPKNEAPKTATTTVQTPPIVAVKEAPKPASVPVKTAAKPATKYVASAQPRAALYGYPDLQVRMVSNPGSVRAGQQINLQFVVENVGTNAAPANWFFTASLPYNPVYTYQSPAQQALYPGDKIIYTLGYAATPASTVGAQYSYGQSGGWTYTADASAWNYGGTYNPNYAYLPAQAGGQTSTASVTVDPYNLVRELNENNNTAGISYQVY